MYLKSSLSLSFAFVVVLLLVRSGFFHHSDQMSQRAKVSKIALWRWSLNVFVIAIALSSSLSVLLVRSCFLITLIKCFKGHKSRISLWLWYQKSPVFFYSKFNTNICVTTVGGMHSCNCYLLTLPNAEWTLEQVQ